MVAGWVFKVRYACVWYRYRHNMAVGICGLREHIARTRYRL
jgi:hypothetical protein